MATRPFLTSFSERVRYVARSVSDHSGTNVELLEHSNDRWSRASVGHTSPDELLLQIVVSDNGHIITSSVAGETNADFVVRCLGLKCSHEGPTMLLEQSQSVAVRLVPASNPDSSYLVLTCSEGFETTIGTLDVELGEFHERARVPGLSTGGCWLGPTGFITNLRLPGAKESAYLIDLVGGHIKRIFHITDDSNDSVVFASTDEDVLVLATDYGGIRRVGLTSASHANQVRFLDHGRLSDHDADPLLLVAESRSLYLVVQKGVRSSVVMYDLAKDRVKETLGLPIGRVHGPARAQSRTAWCVLDSPLSPGNVIRTIGSRNQRWSVEISSPVGSPPSLDVASRWIRTSTGKLEALELGSPKSARVLVIALHGGPISQWFGDYNPALRAFVNSGAYVIAPNPRGSTGYGPDFVRALWNAGGVADANDILDVIAWCARAVRPDISTILYGESYGAFLALLLAARVPALIQGVVAVAPFRSFESLAATATAEVSKLVGALAPVGPTTAAELNLDDLCQKVTAQVLIVHGVADEVIPVEQSRHLARCLRAASSNEGITSQVRLLELPAAPHDVWAGSFVTQLEEEVDAFVDSVSE